jgi:hypothetical protein
VGADGGVVRSLFNYMRPGITFIILVILWIFSSCENRKTTDRQNSQLLDTSKQKMKQEIEGETVEFNYSDFNDLKNNKHYDRFFAGNLTLTTGQVVCTDPMYRELGLPQTWAAKPRSYPVYLYIGLSDYLNGRVAYAELSFKDEIPAEWKISLIPEHLLADSFERKMNGMYPVENGLSSFSDYETFKIYDQETKSFYSANKNGNYYTEILEPLFKKNAHIPKSSRGEDWIDYKPKQAKANIIMFGPGWGDGLYPRYVGYDKNGNVVKLVTDFIRINEKPDDE